MAVQVKNLAQAWFEFQLYCARELTMDYPPNHVMGELFDEDGSVDGKYWHFTEPHGVYTITVYADGDVQRFERKHMADDIAEVDFPHEEDCDCNTCMGECND